MAVCVLSLSLSLLLLMLSPSPSSSTATSAHAIVDALRDNNIHYYNTPYGGGDTTAVLLELETARLTSTLSSSKLNQARAKVTPSPSSPSLDQSQQKGRGSVTQPSFRSMFASPTPSQQRSAQPRPPIRRRKPISDYEAHAIHMPSIDGGDDSSEDENDGEADEDDDGVGDVARFAEPDAGTQTPSQSSEGDSGGLKYYYDFSGMPTWETPPWITPAFRSGPLAYPVPGWDQGKDPVFTNIQEQPVLPFDVEVPTDVVPVSTFYPNYPTAAIPNGRFLYAGQTPPEKRAEEVNDAGNKNTMMEPIPAANSGAVFLQTEQTTLQPDLRAQGEDGPEFGPFNRHTHAYGYPTEFVQMDLTHPRTHLHLGDTTWGWYHRHPISAHEAMQARLHAAAHAYDYAHHYSWPLPFPVGAVVTPVFSI